MNHTLQINSICVFCGSALGKDAIYRKTAAVLGKALADNNIELVYGGSNIGLMRVLADAAMEAGGKVTGIMPKLLAKKEILHSGLTRVITVDTMAERKHLMGEYSDAFITMPGGYGTLDELFEVLSWFQLGIAKKPVAILNVNDYFYHLLQFLDLTVAQGYLRSEHRENILVDKDPHILIEKIRTFNEIEVDSKWVDMLIDDTRKNHKS
ncbi:MAG: TIGR00730 family Rossman fold protein [Bacteroidales bacterium]|jgi:uncharacterized protein (TIGR00730 family)|nr:TIGR00730 family Rossman fold protein [Bacteroidales bacterium]